MLRRALATACCLVSPTVGAQTHPLDLICMGGGSANKASTSSAYAFDNHGNSGSAIVTQHRAEGFDDQVYVHIDGDASRIRLPRTMLPPIHGGDGGWFRLTGLTVEEDRIVGGASVNPLNHPKVFIDRRTGTISIDGKAGHYAGTCAKREADAPNAF